MVGNSLRRCSAFICFLAEEIDMTEGGASSGIGVERPLFQSLEVFWTKSTEAKAYLV
jgi:hypothetical protein